MTVSMKSEIPTLSYKAYDLVLSCTFHYCILHCFVLYVTMICIQMPLAGNNQYGDFSYKFNRSLQISANLFKSSNNMFFLARYHSLPSQQGYISYWHKTNNFNTKKELWRELGSWAQYIIALPQSLKPDLTNRILCIFMQLIGSAVNRCCRQSCYDQKFGMGVISSTARSGSRFYGYRPSKETLSAQQGWTLIIFHMPDATLMQFRTPLIKVSSSLRTYNVWDHRTPCRVL